MKTNYKIILSKQAEKFINKQDKNTKVKILNTLKKLSTNLANGELDIKKLQGFEKRYRVKVGRNIRIIYSIVNSEMIISVIDIDYRGNIYK